MNNDVLDYHFEIINDGNELTESFCRKWDIYSYCDRYNEKLKCSFGGMVVKKDNILLSFPKHYHVDKVTLRDEKSKVLQDMKDILHIIRRDRELYGVEPGQLTDTIPVDAYLYILTYYLEFGLYHRQLRDTVKGYKGHINWHQTINSIRPLLSDGNFIYSPFVVNCEYDESIFITECMDYVLFDFYNTFQTLLDDIHPYKRQFYNPIFDEYDFCIAKLQTLKISYQRFQTLCGRLFKDYERLLLKSLIRYFQWKSNRSKSSKFLTLYFELVWERMIHLYLSKHTRILGDDYEITKEEQSCKLNIIKPNHVDIEQRELGEKSRFSIQFDHYYETSINTEQPLILLFDSKYFTNDVSSFNYKQAFYYYYLRGKYKNAIIKSALVIPTSDEIKTGVHVDRQHIDGLYIREEYINLKDVIDCYKKSVS